MLAQRFKSLVCNKSFSLINKSIARFSTYNTDKLRNIINNEIKYEKENYSPVDENEIRQFKSSTKFEFSETQNTTKMELRKIENNLEEIFVKFIYLIVKI